MHILHICVCVYSTYQIHWKNERINEWPRWFILAYTFEHQVSKYGKYILEISAGVDVKHTFSVLLLFIFSFYPLSLRKLENQLFLPTFPQIPENHWMYERYFSSNDLGANYHIEILRDFSKFVSFVLQFLIHLFLLINGIYLCICIIFTCICICITFFSLIIEELFGYLWLSIYFSI